MYGHPKSYFSPYQNKHLKDGPTGEYLTDRLTDEALRFLDSAGTGPFFLHLSYYAVHTPIQPKEEIAAKYRQKRTQGRQNNPRYSGDNLASNRDRFAPLMGIAAELGISAAQLSLSWLLHRGRDVFPIPGTRKIERIDQNAEALNVVLDSAILDRIDEIARPDLAAGATLL